ncbi:unnamed protein product [Sphagnum jensenii]
MDLVSVTQCAADFHSRLNSSCGSSSLVELYNVLCYTTILPEESISTQPITRAMQISEYVLILKSAI